MTTLLIAAIAFVGSNERIVDVPRIVAIAIAVGARGTALAETPSRAEAFADCTRGLERIVLSRTPHRRFFGREPE